MGFHEKNWDFIVDEKGKTYEDEADFERKTRGKRHNAFKMAVNGCWNLPKALHIICFIFLNLFLLVLFYYTYTNYADALEVARTSYGGLCALKKPVNMTECAQCKYEIKAEVYLSEQHHELQEGRDYE